MAKIIGTGVRWWALGRQVQDGFCKIEGSETFDFAGAEFTLSTGVYYLYVARDAWGARGSGFSKLATPQPESKWVEAERAQLARHTYWRAREKALNAGCSDAAANKSAQRHCEKLGLITWEVHSFEHDRGEEESRAAFVFKTYHGFSLGRCWTQYENALDGLGLRAKFYDGREVLVTPRTGNKEPLHEDVWGNLKDDHGKIVIAIQEMLTK